MHHLELELYVEQVVADAERRLGRGAQRAALDREAREAVLDTLAERPRVTSYVAELALHGVEDTFRQRAEVVLTAPAAN